MSEKYEFSGILINGASTIKILLPKIARIALEFEKKKFLCCRRLWNQVSTKFNFIYCTLTFTPLDTIAKWNPSFSHNGFPVDVTSDAILKHPFFSNISTFQ